MTNPGGVQGTFGFCVEGHGLVRTIGDRWMVGLDDLVGLFQPWCFCDSVILRFDFCKRLNFGGLMAALLASIHT